MMTLRRFRQWLAGVLWTPEPVVAPLDVPVFVTEDVLQATRRLLLTYRGLDGQHEGIVYWAGRGGTDGWTVTTALAPDAITTPDSFTTTVLANARVVDRADRLGVHVLAQVHGHPGPWVGHSDGDNTGAFMPYRGFYSVVVPNYGTGGLLPLTQCGIHQYDGWDFDELDSAEIARRFHVLPSSVDLRKPHAPKPLAR
jgi:hypothetical protein